MDIGFDALLQKVEDNFGIRALRALLALVCLAVVTACFHIIWNNALKPLFDLVGAMPSRWAHDPIAPRIVLAAIPITTGFVLSRFATKFIESRIISRRFDKFENERAIVVKSFDERINVIHQRWKRLDARLAATSKYTGQGLSEFKAILEIVIEAAADNRLNNHEVVILKEFLQKLEVEVE